MSSEHEKPNDMPPSQPTIIGLYAISGSGKSHLLTQLKADPSLSSFAFYDSSQVLDSVTPGGLSAFKTLSEQEKLRYRDAALALVSSECRDGHKTGVVAGHYMFWNAETVPKGKFVGGQRDWETYTHVVYLDTDPEVVARRRKEDVRRGRMDVPVGELRAWQRAERKGLREVCREQGVLFTSIPEHASSVGSVVALRLKTLLLDIQQQTEASNEVAVERALEKALGCQDGVEKVLLLDADRTLAPQDTGAMFWKYLVDHPDFADDPLKALFRSQGYSYASFRQAAMYYEEVADVFDTVCNEVAASVELYPEMRNLLARAAKEPHVRAIVVTCGRAEIWEKVLRRNNLYHVSVIGSGRLHDGYVITASTKGHIVDTLHAKKLRVLAFGDSPLDMAMLNKADQAYIVVGAEATRSTTMDEALSHALSTGLRAHQILLPASSPPRLNIPILPLTPSTINTLFRRSFIHATSHPITSLLATPTRDAHIQGLELRKAHKRIGYHLAMTHLSALLGLGTYDMTHVQGHCISGHEFRDEADTLILPLMRGGEPMAFGVAQALKRASFAHAYTYEKMKPGVFAGKKTIVIVDSVVNTGASVVEFVRALRRNHRHVRVVIVAGVVQAGAVEKGELAEMLEQDADLTLVALRKSEVKYTGKGGTDTGHRLFRTTYLE